MIKITFHSPDAKITREAIAKLTANQRPGKLKSTGAGKGSGEPVAQNAPQILREEFGQKKRSR